jgi:NADH-quinone oxidoreductase subunit J
VSVSLVAHATEVIIAAPADTSTGEAVLFWILGPISVIAALGLLFAKKAVHCALGLATTMICIAIFYVANQAPFLGIVQVVVYTGAVMMLFLFVLMLVGVDSADSLVETLRGQRVAGFIAALALAVLLIGTIGRAIFSGPATLTEANSGGNVQALAELIFTRYVWSFEVTSALLITAALGAMVLTHRERLSPKISQRLRSEERFRTGYGAPLPAPGVYARHNAVDTPGLLPDGTPSEASVSKVLLARGVVRTSIATRELPVGDSRTGVAPRPGPVSTATPSGDGAGTPADSADEGGHS